MYNIELIDFLKGERINKHGRTYQDILNFTDEELESVHNYIQWIFPIREMSENVMGSPYLDNEEEIQFLRNDVQVQENLLKALVRMQDFYRDNDFWLQPNDHNHLRITRIIKSIKLLNTKENAKEFYDFIIDRVANFKPVSDESLNFWKNEF
jgi:hypothetical protein